MECIAYTDTSVGHQALPNARAQLFERFTLLFESSFGEGGGLLKSFLNAARSRFRSAVIEDSEQVTAAVRGRHALPTLKGAGIAREGYLQNRRKLVLCLHDREQALGHLLGTPDASLLALDLQNPLADFAACGVVQLLEPSTEVGIFLEEALKFRGNDSDAFFKIRLKTKLRGHALAHVAALLHALVDQQNVPATASRKERSAKCEAVDFTFHAQLTASPPDLPNIKRDANNGPPETRLDAFERSAERFWNGFCVALHSSHQPSDSTTQDGINSSSS